ncbi:MAG: hypothetical protein ACTSRS_22380 [Candidatus Helarchaeota archaeon]
MNEKDDWINYYYKIYRTPKEIYQEFRNIEAFWFKLWVHCWNLVPQDLKEQYEGYRMGLHWICGDESFVEIAKRRMAKILGELKLKEICEGPPYKYEEED